MASSPGTAVWVSAFLETTPDRQRPTDLRPHSRRADLDKRIAQLLLENRSPLAVEAALTVSAKLEQSSAQADRMRAANVERTRYQSRPARRPYCGFPASIPCCVSERVASKPCQSNTPSRWRC